MYKIVRGIPFKRWSHIFFVFQVNIGLLLVSDVKFSFRLRFNWYIVDWLINICFSKFNKDKTCFDEENLSIFPFFLKRFLKMRKKNSLTAFIRLWEEYFLRGDVTSSSSFKLTSGSFSFLMSSLVSVIVFSKPVSVFGSVDFVFLDTKTLN